MIFTCVMVGMALDKSVIGRFGITFIAVVEIHLLKEKGNHQF